MMMADDKGFDFDFSNCDRSFSDDVNGVDVGFYDDSGGGGGGGVGGVVDDDDVLIDFDSFFTILNEDLPPSQERTLPEFPSDPFYPPVNYSQESVSAAHIHDSNGVHFRSDHGAASESSADTVEALEQVHFVLPPAMSLTESNEASFGKSNVGPGLHQFSNFIESECFPSKQNYASIYDISASCPNQNPIGNMDYGMMLTNEVDIVKHDLADSQSSHSWIDNKTTLKAQVGAANISASEIPMHGFFNSILQDNYPVNQMDTVDSFDDFSTALDEASAVPFSWGVMDQTRLKQAADIRDKKNEGLAVVNGFGGTSSRAIKEDSFGSFDFGIRGYVPSSEAPHSGGPLGHSDDYRHSFDSDRKPINTHLLNGPVSHGHFGEFSIKNGLKTVVRPTDMKHNSFSGSIEACSASLSDDRTYNEADDDDDDDLCVIENLSAPAQTRKLSAHVKPKVSHMSTFTPGCTKLVVPSHQVGVNVTSVKAHDERLIYQAVVQDLSQPKSEATPPDGVLEVPLLRHQRIALSWMVQKETASLQCCGGILADDQGLGKTVSTIALILTERAPLARTMNMAKQCELQTLDLDEEDDKQLRNGAYTNVVQSSSSVRGRPSGGTLVVCPTSVLRQWGDELKNKVSDKVKLSVCMYHGSSRTKDPYELADYDVVLTTYSIVSMEVPKPVGGKDGDDKSKLQDDDSGAVSRKRKHSSKSEGRRLKKEIDDGLFESSARPLAKVNWFRVVLDEAQSIKNYKTQVAQACWGLRAKRRWCLSGTPIQNSVDDLYSYFRFLRYDPYSVYKLFCTMVKFPIAKNPPNGYKKLQAVLKTIMLRRTKGTLLDGKPIINLPPKVVKLKKVEFSEEERDFYTQLEADSRAKFQAYADSGTVKQNYVNILLMLLRLRQACDHPFLVKGYGSSSVLKSSIQAARKLPQEQQISLLSCLEASLAICGICSDPPEDAAVSICGHVFCNQCISERLTGDEHQCPVSKCKTQLSISSVFSKAALKSCLSVDISHDGSQICSGSESFGQAELNEPSLSSCFNSSKIRTALKVLRAISKPRKIIRDNDSMESSVTDVDCSDKSTSTSFSSANESLVPSKVSANSRSGKRDKAIVFSQWTSMLDLLEDGLKVSSINYRRLDGTMSVVARDKAVKDFNTIPEVTVMIMSLKAASLGLNMVAACHVLLLDLWWNPTTEDQAIDRAHRIGQTRPVTVVRLTVKDTVEDRILALQQKKRELVASAFGEDETGSRQSRLTVEDLKYLFMA
ncbi:hypothetical protein vseg_017463 [Gypsophila vaccaria]